MELKPCASRASPQPKSMAVPAQHKRFPMGICSGSPCRVGWEFVRSAVQSEARSLNHCVEGLPWIGSIHVGLLGKQKKKKNLWWYLSALPAYFLIIPTLVNIDLQSGNIGSSFKKSLAVVLVRAAITEYCRPSVCKNNRNFSHTVLEPGSPR